MEQDINTSDPVYLLFGGMEKLGPGDNAHTLHVLRLLPKQQFRVVVDAGCGTGRQTLALAKELGTVVHAVDLYAPFLHDLVRRATEAKVEQLVRPHCMDMKNVPQVFRDIDLLWSEGAAYNIGFANALATWAPALIPEGFAVISELFVAQGASPGCRPGVLPVRLSRHAIGRTQQGTRANCGVQGAYHLHATARVLGGWLLRHSRASGKGAA